MTKYIGLTDDLDRRRAEHGNPSDFTHERTFESEQDARDWESQMIQQQGQTGGTGGAGWNYGYSYTITSTTDP